MPKKRKNNSAHSKVNKKRKEISSLIKQSSGVRESSTSQTSERILNSTAIEVIDVDKLPDRPLSPVNCDDVIEINPPPSTSHSRNYSVPSGLHVVDLTDIFSPVSTNQPVSPIVQSAPDLQDTDSNDSLPSVLKSFNFCNNQRSDLEEKSLRKTSVKCPVCMDNMTQINSDGRKLTSTICGHVFCDECILKAVNTIHSCPTCRTKLTKKQLHPIFL